MAKKLVDVVSNGVAAPQELVVENAIGTDAGAIAPARALQVGGALVAPANPVPVTDAAIGLPGDAAAANDGGAAGLVGLTKRLLTRLTALFQGAAGTPNTNVITIQGIAGGIAQPVTLATLPSLASGTNAIGSVTVSNFPATQPVSLATLPTLAAGTNAIGSVTVSNFPASQAVTIAALPALAAGTNAIGSVTVGNFPATQAISATALPLPAGAATSARQAAPGVAGTPSVDVLSIQGISGGTALPMLHTAVQFFSNYATATRAGTAVLKATAARLCAVDADGTTLTTPLYLQFFNATAAPAVGTRPVRYFPMLANTLLVLGRNELEVDFTTGLVVAVSSTRDTYTAVADVSNVYFTVSFR